jgi:phage terminase small subunit
VPNLQAVETDMSLSPVLIQPSDGSQLTDKEAAFVLELVENGGSMEDAALHAGISPTSARTYAYKMLGKPRVLEAYNKALMLKMAEGASGAIQNIRSLASGAKSEYVKLQANQDVLDRLGVRVPDRVQHQVGGEVKVSIDLG